MIKLSGKERTIGEYLIENLDKNGYLETDLEEIAQIKKADLRETQKLLKLIQGFEPYGVGARSLSECLLIQLNSIKDKQNSIAKAIVKKYLGELKKKKYSLIAKNLKISVDEVKEAVKDILCLEPKPGRSFGNVRDAQTVSPDVFLIPAKDGYQIKLNDDELPELRISSKYKQLLSDKKTSQETKKFLKERLEAALWLIKSVAKRHDTIRRIAETIVEIQKKALDEGHEHLKPLKLKDVADRCNLHISTVSRAVSEKYIETPNGYFRLKDFFSGEFKSEMDSSYSSENLKSEIKKLIDSEDKNNPLTDKDIAETLNKKEMKINRRTIVKYRDQLKIPPSYLRKTLFNGE